MKRTLVVGEEQCVDTAAEIEALCASTSNHGSRLAAHAPVRRYVRQGPEHPAELVSVRSMPYLESGFGGITPPQNAPPP